MSGFRSETTAQQETYWAEDDNWTKEVSFPTLFPRSFVAWKKNQKSILYLSQTKPLYALTVGI